MTTKQQIQDFNAQLESINVLLNNMSTVSADYLKTDNLNGAEEFIREVHHTSELCAIEMDKIRQKMMDFEKSL
jgi:hypothetical protein